MLQLRTVESYDLPPELDYVYERGSLVTPDGALWALGWTNGGEYVTLCRFHDAGVRVITLAELGKLSWLEHKPSLVQTPWGVGLLITPDELRCYDSDLVPTQSLAVGGLEVFTPFALHGKQPRLRAGAFAGLVDGCVPVVLDHGIVLNNPRVIGLLEVSEGVAHWRRALVAATTGRPVDRFGHDRLNQSASSDGCIVGHARGIDGRLVVSVEGSDASSVPKYGMDFFALERLAVDGSREHVYYEQSGWKRLPSKHGIRAKLCSSGRYAVLTPWFSSGDWRGRQRLFDMSTGELLEFKKPRGASDCLIVEHAGDFFWMSDLRQQVLRVSCAQVQPSATPTPNPH